MTARERRVVRYVVDMIRARLGKSIIDPVTGKGTPVTLYGLGTFRVNRCASRVIYGFTGAPGVTPGRKVSFKPSKSLRKLLT